MYSTVFLRTSTVHLMPVPFADEDSSHGPEMNFHAQDFIYLLTNDIPYCSTEVSFCRYPKWKAIPDKEHEPSPLPTPCLCFLSLPLTDNWESGSAWVKHMCKSESTEDSSESRLPKSKCCLKCLKLFYLYTPSTRS